MKKKTTQHPEYHRCVAYFLEKYRQKTGFEYIFTGKDGKALKSILNSISTIKKPDALTYDSFCVIIDRMPTWVIDGYFTLPNIDKYFNQIVIQIKNGTTANAQRRHSSDFVRQQLDILQS